MNKEKLKSKGVASVRSRVVNLKTLNPDIDHDGTLCDMRCIHGPIGMCKALIDEFCKTCVLLVVMTLMSCSYNSPTCPIEELDPKMLMGEPIVKEYHDMLMVRPLCDKFVTLYDAELGLALWRDPRL